MDPQFLDQRQGSTGDHQLSCNSDDNVLADLKKLFSLNSWTGYCAVKFGRVMPVRCR